jgi:hypothetical protein
MKKERKKEWYSKIKEASALWFKKNPDYHPAFNYYDSVEVSIPNDPEYYRVPITIWKEYHEELYNVKIED